MRISEKDNIKNIEDMWVSATSDISEASDGDKKREPFVYSALKCVLLSSSGHILEVV